MKTAQQHLTRGLELRRVHRWKAAIHEFEAAVSVDPECVDGWFWLAASRDNRGEESTAIPAYEEAIRLGLDGDQLGKASVWLASSLSKCGRPEEALRALARAETAGGYRPREEYLHICEDVRKRAERELASRRMSSRSRTTLIP